ncbi:sensor histidine kinase [Rhodococcus sp. CX]|nr:sensor histidine kinase [Rhodococcus sp. CX]
MGRFGRRSVKLANWRLSYKLTAILVVPLLAAVALGALRISTQLDEARRFESLSEQLATIPALFNFSYDVVTVTTAASLGMPAIIRPEQFRQSTADVRALATAGILEPRIVEGLARLIQDGQTLHDTTHTGGTSAEELDRRTIDFLIRCEATFRELLDLAEGTEVLTDGANMLNAWKAQRTMLDQANALGLFAVDPETARLTAQNAMHIEEATLGLLRGSSLDQGRLDGLLENLAVRWALVADFDPPRDSGTELSNAMLAAFPPYQEMNSKAHTQITETLDRLTADARTAATRDSILVTAILVIALGVALLVARALSVPIRRLREGTLAAAHHELPAAIAAVNDGIDITTVELTPIEVHTDEEVGELARAVDTVNSEALRLAGEQAHLRRQISTMLETLARRNKTLVEQQLSLIDSLEYEEKDPTRLRSLFSLDHLATRMRRTGDSLLVLSGTRPRTRTAATPLGDVLRASVSQVENYDRVRIGRTPHGYLVGTAVTDVVHLLAELVDNALRASPPNSTVTFEFSPAFGGGLLLEIADCGIGAPAEILGEINTRLAAGDSAEIHAPRQMGLFVVGRLAARNGISVRLRPTFESETNAGITAAVYFPATLLAEVHHAEPEQMKERPRRLCRFDDSARRDDDPIAWAPFQG